MKPFLWMGDEWLYPYNSYSAARVGVLVTPTDIPYLLLLYVLYFTYSNYFFETSIWFFLVYLVDGYEKANIDPVIVWEQLKCALPDADPEYLRKEANRLSVLSQDDIDNFVEDAIENNQYPTMQEYIK